MNFTHKTNYKTLQLRKNILVCKIQLVFSLLCHCRHLVHAEEFAEKENKWGC